MGRLLGFVLTVLLVLLVGFFLIYNRLVTLRNRYRNAYAQIDVQLLRRHDLVPNLVETARAYLQHERATLEAVIAVHSANSVWVVSNCASMQCAVKSLV